MDLDATATVLLRGAPLACPRDGGTLRADGQTLHCAACGAAYPVVGGVPVLINDDESVFAIADYLGDQSYTGASYGRDADQSRGLRRLYHGFIRWLGDAPSSIRTPDSNEVIAYVAALRPRPRVLVIGSGGLRLGQPEDRVLNTDVAFGPGVDAIADANHLPFADASFDLVVAGAVLEHVTDPQRCVAEMLRVLDRGGFVFAVTPFLQPVHMGAYDFTRFTPIGHRRLFRQFDEIAAGIAMGAGSFGAWSIGGVLMSVSTRRGWCMFARLVALLCTPPLRLLDRWLPNAADSAGGCWFFGRRRDGAPVSDRDLVATYRESFGMGPRTLPPPNQAPPAA